MKMKDATEENKKCPVPLWKRAGYIGFWFFFIKGMLWLVGIAIAFIWGEDIFEKIKNAF